MTSILASCGAPETREYIFKWAGFTGPNSFGATRSSPLNDDSVGVLAKCGGFPEIEPDSVGVIARN
jgi:hypothetical protein